MTLTTRAIGLQSSAKFENITWDFQIACQYDVFNNSAGACGIHEWEVENLERGMGDV